MNQMNNDSKNINITGLTDEEVRQRAEKGLTNRADISTDKTTKEIVISNVFTYFNLIFLVITILLIMVGSFRNLTFLPIIIGNTVIGIVQEIRAKKTLEKMSLLNAPHADVIRNGSLKQISTEELVKDDVILLTAGKQICADAVVISGNIQVNESLLTGEADEVEKTVGSTLMSGSFVVSGECYARLEKVGNESYISKLSLEAKSIGDKEQSEMIRSINLIVKWVGIVIIPIGLILFWQSHFVNGGTAESMEKDYLRLNEDPSRMISHRLGFHAEYTTKKELMEDIAQLAHKYQAPVSVHCSETRKEVEGCRAHSGMTPVAYMDSLGLFNYGGTIFHGVHLDEADYDILKRRGMYVVTNPASNLKLASGIAPINRYLKEGIPVAIGTDGPASNNCLDMFREMFLVTGLQKVVCDDPEAVPAMEVLKMATVNGAHAMGLNECDTLSEGKKADLIMIDLKQPNMQPIQNTEKNLVYAGSKQNVKMTMVAGKVLYQDGEFYLDCPAEEVYEKANSLARKILD